MAAGHEVVEPGPGDRARFDRLTQLRDVHGAAAADVDEIGGGLHCFELAHPKRAVGGRGVREAVDYEVAEGQHLHELVHSIEPLRNRAFRVADACPLKACAAALSGVVLERQDKHAVGLG